EGLRRPGVAGAGRGVDGVHLWRGRRAGLALQAPPPQPGLLQAVGDVVGRVGRRGHAPPRVRRDL
ncbi:MAG: hypothetical protein AVDCRST_MAG68-3440, partial [uncultured Gemmatimonadetes bacterium]